MCVLISLFSRILNLVCLIGWSVDLTVVVAAVVVVVVIYKMSSNVPILTFQSFVILILIFSY